MSELKVAVIAEDMRFVDFLVPGIAAVASGAGVAVGVLAIQKTHGCRPEFLRHLVVSARPDVDLLTVGMDSGGPTHGAQALTPRQKRRGLIQKLGTDLNGAVLAIAAPCIEAWLLVEPEAFRSGIEAALDIHFHMPDRWPKPRSEREAKQALGAVVAGGVGGPLPRHGFEYAGDIVRRMRLKDSPDEALRIWAREFERRLEQAAAQSVL